MGDAEMPVELAASPLGERMAMFLAHLRNGAPALSDDELAATWARTNPRFPFYRDEFARAAARLAGFSITAYERSDSTAGAALLRNPSRQVFRCCVVVDDVPPHRILGSAVFPAPPGVSARPAVDADAPALREIERQTPIVTGNEQVWYDRGEDYFVGERLMGEVEMFVVERDGRIVGMAGRAFPPVKIAGAVPRGLYSHRLRLLPEAQGEGVWGSLNALQFIGGMRQLHAGYVNYAFVAEGNQAALRRIEPERRWPIGVARFVLDTARLAAEGACRNAEPSDVEQLVALFNGLHGREELFVPYDGRALTARLEREPSAYSWKDILMDEDAAVGIWSASLGVRRECDGVMTEDVRALVLDYGCEPGSERTLLTLIRTACGRLSTLGTTELSIFSSEPSPLFAVLSGLAKRVEPYVVACRSRPAADVAEHGIYVDQLYF